MHAYCMGGHADETPRLGRTKQRNHAKGRSSWQIGDDLWARGGLVRLRSRFGWPRLKWDCAHRRAHFALRDETSQMLALPQQMTPRSNFLEKPRPHLSGAGR